MCTGLEVAALASAAASGIGGAMNNRAQARNAQKVADAENARLSELLDRNAQRADTAGALFADRAEGYGEQSEADQAAAVASREARVDTAFDDLGDTAPAVALAGNAPRVVAGTLSGERKRGREEAQDSAGAFAKLASFGDRAFESGIRNTRLGQELGLVANDAAEDASLLGARQQLAGAGIGPADTTFGSLLSGAGQLGAGYFGSKAGAAPRAAPKPKPRGI